MASEKVYPKGVIGFTAKEGQPDWLIGTLIIDPNALFAWLKSDGGKYLTEYKGNNQLKLTLGRGKSGMSISVDTWKPEQKKTSTPHYNDNRSDAGMDDLPFSLLILIGTSLMALI